MRIENVKPQDGPSRTWRSLPPLDLLPGFEASARLLSFSRAAEELFVTQSAMSRQIKTLEEALGVALFVRGHRSLALTSAGQDLYRATQDVLGELRQVTARLRPGPQRHQVTVTTVAGFAALWLIPRLARFAEAAPAVDVRISVSHEIIDLEREQIDLAVRYCSPQAFGATVLFKEVFLPVCAPALACDPHKPLRAIEDLHRHALLEQADGSVHVAMPDWRLYLRSVGLADLMPLRTLSFSQYDSVIAAAVAGQGVALGRLPLVNQYLSDARLVAPFAKTHVSEKAYCLVVAARARANPDAQQFIDWLLEESRLEREH